MGQRQLVSPQSSQTSIASTINNNGRVAMSVLTPPAFQGSYPALVATNGPPQQRSSNTRDGSHSPLQPRVRVGVPVVMQARPLPSRSVSSPALQQQGQFQGGPPPAGAAAAAAA